MSELPMPSEVRAIAAKSAVDDARRDAAAKGGEGSGASVGAGSAPIEPPSIKMVARLFVIPLLIAAAVVGIMLPIGYMAEGPATLDQAIERLKKPGGERTLNLVGPGSKQRYMDAKTLVDHMKAGLDEGQRIRLADQLVEILEKYVRPEEGEVQHFVLLALGRVWQKDPRQGEMNSLGAQRSREATLDTLLKYFDAPDIQARKAAILALAFWQGQEEARRAIPVVIRKLSNPQEDVDVRMAAAATLGNIGSGEDQEVVEALGAAMNETDPQRSELVWNAASSLARLGRSEATATMMKLLSRTELAKMRVYDRETDPKNPVYRGLSDLEQQRFLTNAMQSAAKLKVPEVQAQLKKIAETDPSVRVRAMAVEVMSGKTGTVQ
jgi:Rps23 Pro-64 3,4-dihydroxylase Tpa1-like proline 4-hydroxylase